MIFNFKLDFIKDVIVQDNHWTQQILCHFEYKKI